MAVAAKTEPAKTLKTVGIFADEAHWASLLGAYRGHGIAKVLRPLIREALRKGVKEIGIDPDEAWADFEGQR
jgi:hypothetical protein